MIDPVFECLLFNQHAGKIINGRLFYPKFFVPLYVFLSLLPNTYHDSFPGWQVPLIEPTEVVGLFSYARNNKIQYPELSISPW